MIKLGIYGGTFSPVHKGHIRAAHAFYDSLSLDKLLIIPTFTPPHKQEDGEASVLQRLEMTRLAFSDDVRNIEVSDWEIKQGGKSYTYLTLQNFSSHEAELYFLCGTDMFFTFDDWKNPDIIFSLCTVAVVRREEGDSELDKKISDMAQGYKERYNAKIVFIDSEPFPVSSSLIRSKIKSGEDISEYLTDKVVGYIRDNGIYGAGEVNER